jgi:8-oxo-dGTP diphosphatase
VDFDTRVGAYAVIVRDGHVLLTHWVVQESQRQVAGGLQSGWTLPGGGLEAGEDPEAAAVREVLEETGYVVELTRLLGTNSLHFRAEDRLPSQPRRPFHSLRLVYEGRIVAGDIRVETDGSTDDVRWVPLDEVAALSRVSLVDVGLRLWRRRSGRTESAGAHL